MVGSNTDVVLKLMNQETEKCIRYVYIRHGENYEITNIPEGIYYLKIAYGMDWRNKIENNTCIGKFIKNPLYKKGEDVLDFRKVFEGIKTENGKEYKSWSIPSYSLTLDVEIANSKNEFDTYTMSEEEFND